MDILTYKSVESVGNFDEYNIPCIIVFDISPKLAKMKYSHKAISSGKLNLINNDCLKIKLDKN